MKKWAFFLFSYLFFSGVYGFDSRRSIGSDSGGDDSPPIGHHFSFASFTKNPSGELVQRVETVGGMREVYKDNAREHTRMVLANEGEDGALQIFIREVFPAYVFYAVQEGGVVGRGAVRAGTNSLTEIYVLDDGIQTRISLEGAIGDFHSIQISENGSAEFLFFAPKSNYWPLYNLDGEVVGYRSPANGKGLLYIYKLNDCNKLVWVRTEVVG